MFMEAVFKFFRELAFDCNTTIVAAISGGPDSMFLLDVLLEYKKDCNCNIVVAHVNHNLREESKKEKKDLENFCLFNKIPFEYYEIEKRKDKSLTEVEARNIRYSFFDQVMNKYSADYLATAHHGDDLVETVMMRIVRGSTLKGYAAFSQISERSGYKIIRPLISLTKKDMIDYLDKKKICYAIDATNCSEKYTRNRFRLNVLPFLKNEDKRVHLKFKKFSDTLLRYDKFVKNIAKNELKNVFVDDVLYIDKFKGLDELIQREVISIILETKCAQVLEKLNEKHLNNVLEMIFNNKPNLKLNLPENFVVLKEYNKVRITKVTKQDEFVYELDGKVVLPNGMTIEKVEKIDNNSNYMTRLNSSEILLPLYIRNKKISDKMKIKGMNNYKKIKDIFIDEKIPISDRKNWPIVEDSDGNIVWVPGLKKSVFDKKANEEYDIILHYF